MSMHATLTTLREINASVVLEAIRQDPPISRAEVSRRTGMTKPTVANALDLLVTAGLVRQAAPPGEMHYGAVYFEPVHDLAHVLALDIGTRFVRGAICDLSGRMLARHDERIDDSTPETVLRAAQAVHTHLTTTPVEESTSGTPDVTSAGGLPVELVVIGVPGVVDPEEGVIRQSNRAALEGMAIRAELSAALGVPAEVETDVNLAVIGEHASGAGRGVAHFAFLSIGAGVGAGLVLGDRPHRGYRGAAGEVDDAPPGQEELPDSPSGDVLMSWARQWIAATLPIRTTPEPTPLPGTTASSPRTTSHPEGGASPTRTAALPVPPPFPGTTSSSPEPTPLPGTAASSPAPTPQPGGGASSPESGASSEGATRLRADATPEGIFAAAAAGDELAQAILAEEARRIAVRIATISRVVDVELVVLGGGIGLACAGILPQVDAALATMLRHPPRVAVSALGNAPVLAGALAHGTRLVRESVATRLIAAAARSATPQVPAR